MTSYGTVATVTSFLYTKVLSASKPTLAETAAYSPASYYGYYGMNSNKFAGTIEKNGGVLVYRYQDNTSVQKIKVGDSYDVWAWV